VLDADPIQCLRVAGPTAVTFIAAAGLGRAFIAATFKWYMLTAIAGFAALCAILYWVWTGTAARPEKDWKAIGLGVRVPLYVSGPRATGW
jgi:cytochrome c oxidase subunit I+III